MEGKDNANDTLGAAKRSLREGVINDLKMRREQRLAQANALC